MTRRIIDLSALLVVFVLLALPWIVARDFDRQARREAYERIHGGHRTRRIRYIRGREIPAWWPTDLIKHETTSVPRQEK